MATCKYYNPHMQTIREYCRALYKLEGCGCGGNLHILLDDDNINDSCIVFCLKECLRNPEAPESNLGILICEEYLKLTIQERSVMDSLWCDMDVENWPCTGNCETCELMSSLEWYEGETLRE